MADTTAPAMPSPMWDTLKALAPSIGQSLVMIVGLLVAVGTTYLVAKPVVEHKVIEAADKPKPTPIDETATLDHLLGIHASKLSGDIKTEIAALRALIDERIPAPAPKVAPSRVRMKGITP